MKLLVDLTIDELVILRSALGRLRLDGRARMKRLNRDIKAGKSPKLRPSELAMELADVEHLRSKIHDLITKKGSDDGAPQT